MAPSSNQFDNLRSNLQRGAENLRDEFDRYLSSEPETVKDSDVLTWWIERRKTYPRLSRMAIDYLSIPGMSFCS